MTSFSMRRIRAGWAPVLKPRHAFQSPEKTPSDQRNHIRAAALAMLCTAHCASAAAVPLSSAASSPARTKADDGYARWITEASQRFGIPIAWIAAVMRVESGGDAHAISSKGAMGLMQIMPRTWADLQVRYHLGGNPFDPHDNIIGGVAYLRELEDRFGAGNFLAAYHAGPGQLVSTLTGLRPLGVQTKAYLTRLAQLLPDIPIDRSLTAESVAVRWQMSALFINRSQMDQMEGTGRFGVPVTSSPPERQFALNPHPDGLFVPTSAPEAP